jgi:arylformamidase
MPIFDLTLPLSPRLPVYPDNPPFELSPVKRLDQGASANVSRLVLGTHTGTHVDAPHHFFDGRRTVDDLPLDRLIGPCRVVHVKPAEGRGISVDDLLRAGAEPVPERLLLRTPNSELWGAQEDFTPGFSFLTAAAARWLADARLKLVGIDYLSIEEYRRPGAPAHRALLGEDVVIVEGLNLAAIEPGEYELICLPLPIAGGDGAPARVVLRR